MDLQVISLDELSAFSWVVRTMTASEGIAPAAMRAQNPIFTLREVCRCQTIVIGYRDRKISDAALIAIDC